jgi:nucleotide-binding universal stress UspA family protein
MSHNTATLAASVEDFRRARSRAKLEEMKARLTGKSARLFSYEDVRQKLGPTGSAERGLHDIPLDAIVGSVGRYDDFTRSFLPRADHDESRWARVKTATLDLTGVPPIEVYKVGEAYFVLDGNHRVSVARDLKSPTIQAYVTEIRTKVPFSPDDQPDDLIVKAEYVEFLEYTHLDELRPDADLTVTAPGKYPILKEHIEVHQYFMGTEQRREIPNEEAIGHWYDHVYFPVVNIIRDQGALWNFPHRTEADLYLWILRHRVELAETLGWDIDTETAAADLVNQFSTQSARQTARLSARILDAVTPDPLESGPAPGQWRVQKFMSHREDRLFTHILVPISGEARSWPALEQAALIARHEGGQVFGLHVISSDTQRESEITQALVAEFNQRCETAGVAGELAIEVGTVPRQICQRTIWSDLIVADLTHPPGSKTLAKLGSKFRTLIRRSATPILAVPTDPSPLNRGLLAYDGSPKADEALFVASYLAGQRKIPLTVLTVLGGNSTEQNLNYARHYLESRGVEATYVQEQGPVAQAILDTAATHESELILLGGYGRKPVVEVVLGSAVDQVLREFRKPILICR